MKILAALAMLLPIAAFAQTPASAPAATPSDGIKCSDWYKTPSGDWRSKPDTVVNYGPKPLILNKVTVTPGDYMIDKQDVYALVDEKCGN